jgi:hypothetical protein
LQSIYSGKITALQPLLSLWLMLSAALTKQTALFWSYTVEALTLCKFSLTQLETWTDGRTDGRTHKQTDGRTDGLPCTASPSICLAIVRLAAWSLRASHTPSRALCAVSFPYATLHVCRSGQAGSYAAAHLVLHGLWPDFGQIYYAPSIPSATNLTGAYQDWGQWCTGRAHSADTDRFAYG